MRSRWSLALPGLALALSAAPAGAEILSDPRGVAMGGAVRGDPVANSALFYNPAGMSRTYTYAAQVQYFRAGATEANAPGLSIVDSKTQPTLGVGVAYSYEFADEGAPIEQEGHNARLGFSHALVPNQAYLGVGLHYLHLNRAPVRDLKAFTLDAGALLSLTQSFHLGLTGHNLINVRDATHPVMAGGGVAYTSDLLTLDFDTLIDFTTASGARPVFMGGVEVLLGDTVPVRAGFERNNATERTYAAGGLGFITSSSGTGTQFNLAFRQGIEDTRDFLFGVGLVFFL